MNTSNMDRCLRAALLGIGLALIGAPAIAQDAPVEDAAAPVTESAAAVEPPPPEVQAPSLEQAYQREFAFLQGQKADLERRLAELQDRMGAEQSELEAEIRALEAEVVEMGGEADRLEDRVFESELAVDTARENTDVLASTFLQADFSLAEAYSPDLGDRAPAAEDVSGLFDAALGVLRDAGSIRVEDGEFFLIDGARVDGRIVEIGGIAAYGVSPRGSGVLAPAGDGGLKLWNEDTAEVAEALAAGRAPDSLPIFIFESTATEVEKKGTKGLFDVIRSGGVIGWIIFYLGLLGLALVVLRVVFLQRASASTSKILDAVSGHVRRGDASAALDVLKRKKGSTSRVVSAAIRNLDRDREHLEDIVSEAILHESSHLNRFGAFIMVIAAVSPLLGLLGTVTGMISTFDVITEFGTGDPKLLSGGISIALVTTELGLIVAIPMLVFGNLLSGWAEGIKDDMEKAALRVINQYYEGRARGVESA
ncbi:flagellar motor protein MotA [Wenzhouxiangella sp. XN79A]|uniref:MotA/TolQ/ExbB proton channel family protein n=1 Tax=Wenzhouxiangella sp. XN79A TaxID=2724193 RepID=UPI00144AD993|nr:MotA/TolQ/ExbB proton channel family protein [Wenzhouxiangella sp. XN79A]NKI33652.1 flagellar motor protein MotA [Wenzhouxiangella sp. XN79A]